MSSLFRIKIEERNNSEITFRLYIIHPDQITFPQTPAFALNILLDCWRRALNGYFFEGESIIPEKKDKLKIIAAESTDNQILEKLYQLSDGITIEITKKEYLKIQKSGNWNYKGKRITSFSQSDEKFYVSCEPDYSLFEDESIKYVSVKGISEVKNYPWQEVPKFKTRKEEEEFFEKYYSLENVPQAKLIVNFNEILKMEYMLTGTEWETTIWR